jgi:hypothetical protein
MKAVYKRGFSKEKTYDFIEVTNFYVTGKQQLSMKSMQNLNNTFRAIVPGGSVSSRSNMVLEFHNFNSDLSWIFTIRKTIFEEFGDQSMRVFDESGEEYLIGLDQSMWSPF